MANLKNKLSQNDTAWEILFDRHSILDSVQKKGFFEISANLIKTVREPRLMTKFDNQSNLPVVFKKLCHFTKLFTIEGMTPCKTLTLMKL